jgi:hypothetical protein
LPYDSAAWTQRTARRLGLEYTLRPRGPSKKALGARTVPGNDLCLALFRCVVSHSSLKLPVKIYRSRALPGAIVIILGLFFVAFGAFGIYASGIESAGFFGMFIGAGIVVGILGGIGLLSARVVVDNRGLVRSNLYHVTFEVSWDDIESWSIGPIALQDPGAEDSFGSRKVEFRVRDGRKNLVVHDSDVELPGFDIFVADVRRALPDRGDV